MALRIHHLNCMSLRPVGGRLIDGRSGWFERARFVSHCLLVETGDGLALVDTGLGLGDVLDPEQRLSSAMLSLFKPQLRAVVRIGNRHVAILAGFEFNSLARIIFKRCGQARVRQWA